ncbi:MAG: hypothetical protein V1702_04540 [Candidatus Woesearchaeota archaeon]
MEDSKMKLIAYPVIFLLIAGIAMAADMSRSMPDKASPGDTITVTFSISAMEVGKQVAISEVIPSGWKISDWTVAGSQEAKDAVTFAEKTGGEYQWSFTASTASPSLSYTLKVPQTALGSYNFDAVYILPPANMNNLKKSLAVRVITCGDGTCEGTENSDSCLADCPKPAEQPAQPAPSATTTVPPEETAEKGESNALTIGLLIVVAIVALFFLLKYQNRRRKRKQLEKMLSSGSFEHHTHHKK